MNRVKKGIAFIVIAAILCSGFAVLARAVNKSNTVIAADISYQTDSEDAPKVYMTYESGVLTIENLTSKADLIHASYYNGALIGAEILEAENGTQSVNAYKDDKFFLWDSIDTMKPLFAAITVNEGADPPTPTPKPTPVPTPEAEDSKTLVVYYSATDTTERIANMIAEYTEADIFELEPKEPYSSDDLDWTDSESRVNYEHNNPDTRHVELVSVNVDNFDSYDTVFIGYPIWWQKASWVVDDFVKENDFSGKTVIPFCTSMSSPLGDSGTELAAMAGTGNWLEGKRFTSRSTSSEVQEWIDGIE